MEHQIFLTLLLIGVTTAAVTKRSSANNPYEILRLAVRDSDYQTNSVNAEMCQSGLRSCTDDLMKVQREGIWNLVENWRQNGINDICALAGRTMNCLSDKIMSSACYNSELYGNARLRSELQKTVELHTFVCQRRIEVINKNRNCLLDRKVLLDAEMCMYSISLGSDACGSFDTVAACLEGIVDNSGSLCRTEVKWLAREGLKKLYTHYLGCEESGRLSELIFEKVMQLM